MADTPLVVDVAVPIAINSLFKYAVPEGSSIDDVLFKRVLINFRGRDIQGYAVRRSEHTDTYKIKKIDKILDRRVTFNNDMVELAKWIADYYFCGIGEVLSLMVPKGRRDSDCNENNTHFSNIRAGNVLSNIQNEVYDSIIKDIASGDRRFYLYGITGSGKTEIYIKLIEYMLQNGKDAILLVPEIALSYQIFDRVKKEFGSLCAILHSGLKTSEKFREYLRLLDGKAKIAIGARSAIFAPLKNLGIIIIDEENDASYKSQENPRFHTRTVAQYLANKKNATIVLGSATPSVESWYYAQKGYFKLYMLTERYKGASLPSIDIIDNSKTAMVKNLSINLVEEVNKRLKNSEQIIILQNRRGFANFIKCKDCGFIFICPKCNVSLTYHKNREKLVCHHCGYSMESRKKCEKCKSEKLIKIGAGTERIEDEIKDVFSHARVERIDLDVSKKIKDIKNFFKKIENREIDIIVGTQMIAKGLHFPGIKLVGIVNADLMLNLPDYKASERTFSLITQVAGRAGREGERGHVVIQTFNPDHYAITTAKDGDYLTFYEKEIQYRRVMRMPPFTRIVRVVVRGKDEMKVKKDIERVSNLIKENITKDVTLLGPAPCILSKINNNHRYQILLKSSSLSVIQKSLNSIKSMVKIDSKNFLEIDIDPVDLL